MPPQQNGNSNQKNGIGLSEYMQREGKDIEFNGNMDVQSKKRTELFLLKINKSIEMQPLQKPDIIVEPDDGGGTSDREMGGDETPQDSFQFTKVQSASKPDFGVKLKPLQPIYISEHVQDYDHNNGNDETKREIEHMSQMSPIMLASPAKMEQEKHISLLASETKMTALEAP